MSIINLDPPAQNNIWTCSSYYGAGLNSRDCITAVSQLPSEHEPQTYVVDGSGIHSLPSVFNAGGCTVAVQLAGPADPRGLGTYMLNPEEIKSLAYFLVGRCVMAQDGLGGFATGAFENMLNFVNSPGTNLHTPFPPTSSFITVTLAGRNRPLSPGDFDPIVPWRIYEAQGSGRSEYADRYYLASNAMQSQQSYVDTKDWKPWWSYLPLSLTSRMDYACDAGLGAPDKVDCALLEYERLGPPSDAVSIGPGASKVLSSNTCSVAISSSVPVTLTWEQITAAVNALVVMCVSSPIKGSAIGGTATYGVQGSSLAGRRKKRQTPGISGKS